MATEEDGLLRNAGTTKVLVALKQWMDEPIDYSFQKECNEPSDRLIDHWYAYLSSTETVYSDEFRRLHERYLATAIRTLFELPKGSLAALKEYADRQVMELLSSRYYAFLVEKGCIGEELGDLDYARYSRQRAPINIEFRLKSVLEGVDAEEEIQRFERVMKYESLDSAAEFVQQQVTDNMESVTRLIHTQRIRAETAALKSVDGFSLN